MPETDKDRQARELYVPRAPHWPGCGKVMSLADQLRRICPHCGEHTLQGLAPEVTLDRAAEMLSALQARRNELGLSNP
jgi:hypothetical protein